MIQKDMTFLRMKGKIYVAGIPELVGVAGINLGNDMVAFRGEEYAMYMANIKKRIIRQFATKEGLLLVDDTEIDYCTIANCYRDSLPVARAKELRWGVLYWYDDFKKGFCALSWTLCPDGMFFMDEDGFGMENNNEETVYAIINMDLEIVLPFSLINNVGAYLRSLRKHGLKNS